MVEKKFLSIIVPTLNEERYASQAILTLPPRPERFDYEILVLDGGSTDRTVEIVSQLAEADPRIKLFHNEKRLQSAAINSGAMIADPRAEVLVRADCHALYPEKFVERVYDALLETGASSVVVPMITIGTGCQQVAIAAAQNSRLGNGGSLHRRPHTSRWVEHGHHAAFRREIFTALGGYDETFSHNEDAEFDIRNVRAGGRIWIECEAAVKYFPRASLSKLAQQYLMHGSGRAKTYLKHRQRLNPRQLLPVAVLLISVTCLAAAFVYPYALVAPFAYFLTCLAAGVVIGFKHRSLCATGSGVAAMVMHISWAFGFLKGLAAGSPLLSPKMRGGNVDETP